MTAQLVRLPDQFRPARSAPTAATPTCCCSCCCCCCCAATLISASVVLPTQVEILARRGMVGDPRAGVQPRPPPDDLRIRKLLGALTPSFTIVAWIVVSWYVGRLTLGALTVPAVLVGLSYVVFSEFPRRGVRAAVNAAVIIASFAVEFVLGFFLILGTFGIGYLILMVIVPILVIGFFNRRRDALPPRWAMPPPPYPWPPES